MAATRLPSAPRSASLRTETGTIAFSSSPFVRTLSWSRRYLPSPRLTTDRTTSLRVPPSESLIALNSARSASRNV